MKKHVLLNAAICAVVMSLLNSCLTYNKYMSIAPSHSIPQKAHLTIKSIDTDIISESGWILQDYIRSDLSQNYLEKTGLSQGTIEVKVNNYHYGNYDVCNYAFVFYPVFLLGIPYGVNSCDINITFQIRDANNSIVKSYDYSYSDRQLIGWYYGKTYNRIVAEAAHEIMAKFQKDYLMDANDIQYALAHPKNIKKDGGYICLTNPYTKPIYYEMDQKYLSAVPGLSYKTVKVTSGQHEITSYPSFYSKTTTTYVGGTLILGIGSTPVTSTQNFEDLTYEQAKEKLEPNEFKINIPKDKVVYVDDKKTVDVSVIEKNGYANVNQNSNAAVKSPVASAYKSHQVEEVVKKQEIISDVDKNIPVSSTSAESTFAVIISNEEYDLLDNVTFANRDGKIFKEYCLNTLGIPNKQIFYYENATFGQIADGISKLVYCLDNFDKSKAIVYYCGHGIPDEKTGEAYLIPVDGKGTNMTTCYSLKTLYKTLAATKAESITYFMDACFTGANKEGSMLVSARGVAREPKKEVLSGKTVVFSASSGDETAMTLQEQGHGLFTYYLLKKLQESAGNVTYGELADYIKNNVKKEAFLTNEKPQTPIVATSPEIVNTWKTMKMK